MDNNVALALCSGMFEAFAGSEELNILIDFFEKCDDHAGEEGAIGGPLPQLLKSDFLFQRISAFVEKAAGPWPNICDIFILRFTSATWFGGGGGGINRRPSVVILGVASGD